MAGWRSTTISGLTFTVESRYNPLRLLGAGAYGTVCEAADGGEESHVAIKRIAGILNDTSSTHTAAEAKRVLRELMLLRHLQHDNLLNLRHVMLAPPAHIDIYIVSECMDTDLAKLIASDNVLSDDHCRFFIYQLLCGVQYMHDMDVMHRDLKPSNILINRDCDLRIADFGLARSLGEHKAAPLPGAEEGVDADGDGEHDLDGTTVTMTQYVVTRWYRAPELLLLCRRYSLPVDMWSVGCILGELLCRRTLFPGKTFLHQLELIVAAVGMPEPETLADADERLRGFLNKLALDYKTASTSSCPLENSLERVVASSPADARTLLEALLCFHPDARLTAHAALNHDYLAQFRDDDEEEDDDGGEGSSHAGGRSGVAPAVATSDGAVPPCSSGNGAALPLETATESVRGALRDVESTDLDWPRLKLMLLREVDYWQQTQPGGQPTAAKQTRDVAEVAAQACGLSAPDTVGVGPQVDSHTDRNRKRACMDEASGAGGCSEPGNSAKHVRSGLLRDSGQ